MKEDRLHKDSDEIHNPEDIIEAHDERRSHFAGDVDPYQPDVEISEDVDVDEALTFPHPKHKKSDDIELLDLPDKEETDEEWRFSDEDFQPEDYEHNYDEATDAHATDSKDEVAEEQMHEMSHMDSDDVAGESTFEVMPNKFQPDEETES